MLQFLFGDVFLTTKDCKADALILGPHEVCLSLGKLAAQIAGGFGWSIRIEMDAMNAAKHGAELSVKANRGEHAKSCQLSGVMVMTPFPGDAMRYVKASPDAI
jgi:hypothetical protein